MGSAYASFDETIKGSIEPGKLADMVVVSDDILSVPAVEIEKTRVQTTVFDGKVIYRRSAPGKRVQ
jgi:predicted amidohydrolase YtcJ